MPCYGVARLGILLNKTSTNLEVFIMVQSDVSYILDGAKSEKILSKIVKYK
jgi:hypothetical protein